MPNTIEQRAEALPDFAEWAGDILSQGEDRRLDVAIADHLRQAYEAGRNAGRELAIEEAAAVVDEQGATYSSGNHWHLSNACDECAAAIRALKGPKP